MPAKEKMAKHYSPPDLLQFPFDREYKIVHHLEGLYSVILALKDHPTKINKVSPH